MSTRLKICGITTLADARFCAAAGADYLGFVQYEESPRYLTPKTAAEIIEWVYGSQAVGVFVNASADEVNRAADTAGFVFVQLHGDESPALCSSIDRPIIKALHVGPEATMDTLQAQVAQYEAYVEAFLLDSGTAAQWGGTGKRFEWELACDLAETHRLFLAGGINVENVREAIETVNPFAIDLSSSLESAPGEKDIDKVTAFIDVFRATTA